MKIGILGSGDVAQTLASGFLKHGHQAMMGTSTISKLDSWISQNPAGRVGSFEQAAAFGEVVVLAVKGSAAASVLRLAGANNLAGKPVIDTTNPMAEAPPTNGVIKFFTNLDDSLMEQLQREYPEAKLVKAFNTVGNQFMVNPQFKDGKGTMFICGNDEKAKETVTSLLTQFGWPTADMGKVESARAIEPLCMLWCLPGFLRNEWNHAFAIVQVQ